MVGPAGSEWLIEPHVGDLTEVQAGLSTAMGRFSVSWKASDDLFTVSFKTPKDTTGTLAVPLHSKSAKVMQGLNVELANGTGIDSQPIKEDFYVTLSNLPGGSYYVRVAYTNTQEMG